MKKRSTFTKGSGCYTCRSCSRQTRDDGNGDSVEIRLCTQCFELSSMENTCLDGGALSDSEKEYYKNCLTQVIAKGGKVSTKLPWEQNQEVA